MSHLQRRTVCQDPQEIHRRSTGDPHKIYRRSTGDPHCHPQCPATASSTASSTVQIVYRLHCQQCTICSLQPSTGWFRCKRLQKLQSWSSQTVQTAMSLTAACNALAQPSRTDQASEASAGYAKARPLLVITCSFICSFIHSIYMVIWASQGQ